MSTLKTKALCDLGGHEDTAVFVYKNYHYLLDTTLATSDMIELVLS